VIRTLAFTLFATALCAPAHAAEDLGRLFFTPEQRAAFDARRKSRTPDRPAPVVASTVRLDGYVKRSGGRNTVWVNGESVDSPARLPEGTETRVTVRADEQGQAVRLKPGEILNRENGKVSDVIGGGEIKVRRPAP